MANKNSIEPLQILAVNYSADKILAKIINKLVKENPNIIYDPEESCLKLRISLDELSTSEKENFGSPHKLRCSIKDQLMPSPNIPIKVTIEFTDKIISIEGPDAAKWHQHNKQLALLGDTHNCNPFDLDPIRWEIITKE